MDDLQAWDFYFMSMAGWYFHPGNTKSMNAHVAECRAMADLMLKTRQEKWQQ